ncbi:hypothetical protein B0T25DRAFT_309958 [Lasiosphaeria hispida]|uniref:Uncharacterized protein n=1 Tax=Lasiosphaeria hispida TaxID=260671 RepID=A0AAJ0H8V3_9PEZI|nr:hypothetical protein B0T25DRAFT_309958 [Lasiosphaeria hispida]
MVPRFGSPCCYQPSRGRSNQSIVIKVASLVCSPSEKVQHLVFCFWRSLSRSLALVSSDSRPTKFTLLDRCRQPPNSPRIHTQNVSPLTPPFVAGLLDATRLNAWEKSRKQRAELSKSKKENPELPPQCVRLSRTSQENGEKNDYTIADKSENPKTIRGNRQISDSLRGSVVPNCYNFFPWKDFGLRWIVHRPKGSATKSTDGEADN